MPRADDFTKEIWMLAAAACRSLEGLGADISRGGRRGGAKDSIGLLSSGCAPEKVERRASTGGLFADWGRDVNSCVTKSMDGL